MKKTILILHIIGWLIVLLGEQIGITETFLIGTILIGAGSLLAIIPFVTNDKNPESILAESFPGTIIPNRNNFNGKGNQKYSYIELNIEIKRLLQGAIIGYGIDNIEELHLEKQKVWSFIYEDNSEALTKEDVRHLINSMELDLLITNSLQFQYEFD